MSLLLAGENGGARSTLPEAEYGDDLFQPPIYGPNPMSFGSGNRFRIKTFPTGAGRTKQQDFLAHTRPLVIDSAPAPAMQSLGPELLRLTLPSLPGRGLFVEQLPDLTIWQAWSGYENQGTEPAPGSPLALEIPATPPGGFFRTRIKER